MSDPGGGGGGPGPGAAGSGASGPDDRASSDFPRHEGGAVDFLQFLRDEVGVGAGRATASLDDNVGSDAADAGSGRNPPPLDAAEAVWRDIHEDIEAIEASKKRLRDDPETRERAEREEAEGEAKDERLRAARAREGPPDLDKLFGPESSDADEEAEAERRVEILGPFLRNKLALRTNGDVHLFWRALWSIEFAQDVRLSFFGIRHFVRWEREVVPEGDPYRDLDSKAMYFPGRAGSHDAKCAWAGVVVEESAANDMRPAFDASWPRDHDIPPLDGSAACRPSYFVRDEEETKCVGDIISDILLSCAPDELSVCLYIPRKMIDGFLAPAVPPGERDEEEDEGPSYVSNATTQAERDELERKCEASKRNPGLESVFKFLSSPYLRDDAPGGKVPPKSASEEHLAEQIAAFKEWLKSDSPVVGTLHQEEQLTKLPPKRYDKLASRFGWDRQSPSKVAEENDLVLLARMDNVGKMEDTETVLEAMIESLGLHDSLVGIQTASSRNPDVHGYAYFTRDKLGGNVHYPDDNDATSVAFTWSSTRKLTWEHMKDLRFRRAFETDFVRRAEARKEASEGRIHYLLWPREFSCEPGGDFSRERTAEVTPANAHIIWLPGDYEAIETDVFGRLLDGAGTSSGVGLRMTGTADGNHFWDNVFRYFKNTIVGGDNTWLLDEYRTIPNEQCFQMCQLLAVTRAFVAADELLVDHEFTSEEIQDFFDKFSREWRKVLSQSDESLGFGLSESYLHVRALASREVGRQVAEIPDLAAQTPSHSREGLLALIESHGLWIQNELADSDINVSLVPNSGEVDINGNSDGEDNEEEIFDENDEDEDDDDDYDNGDDEDVDNIEEDDDRGDA